MQLSELMVVGAAFLVALLIVVIERFFGRAIADFFGDDTLPPRAEESCDVCGSNCGQCGSSYPKRGNGKEVFDAAVNFINRNHK